MPVKEFYRGEVHQQCFRLIVLGADQPYERTVHYDAERRLRQT